MKFHFRLLNALVDFSIHRPRTVMLTAAVLFIAAAVQLPRIAVDTDPENMLPAEQAARVFHNETKKDFTLHDMIVVGIVNEQHANGVFNTETLERVHRLTREIEAMDGVVKADVMSLAAIDNIRQDGPGTVRFSWMMRTPPETEEDALAIRDAVRRLPTVVGTLVSEDEKATGIYVPITSKDESHRIAGEIERIFGAMEGAEQFHIAGLPVAEDTFGVEMFKQMGIAAPLAGLIIVVVMWLFFRSVALVLSPMILAIATVIVTMGLLIGLGIPVHIMSSMIPIFLMPIAVVDSVHILSEFADLYPRIGDKKETLRRVMRHLLQPMYYTSLTSAAGFLSLVLAPIPPVRVFGVFVAIGITLAFYLTITFIPAYVVRMSEARIAKLRKEEEHDDHILARVLNALGPWTVKRAKLVTALTAGVILVSAVGISRIEINDNPVRWFRSNHKIRVADRVLNDHFGGTYNAFLVLEKTPSENERSDLEAAVTDVLSQLQSEQGIDLTGQWNRIVEDTGNLAFREALDAILDEISARIDGASTDDEVYAWEDVQALIEERQTRAKYFQSPEALEYIARLQEELVSDPLVGKTTSLADVVKTVHRELREGNAEYFTIPGSANGVAQTLLSFQSSHRPHDLWHFVTPDFRKAQIWVQLASGDNKDMTSVTERVDEYINDNPLPAGVSIDWAGLTYLNVVWQQAMVAGMRDALAGSFIVVFVMMVVLFRSFWFGLLAMLPLSVTIAFIYGIIGLAGKDYDMPVAVLSSLTLGLSVDFAIHFLQRARQIHERSGEWMTTVKEMFGEPARAITRNAIVIAVGFLPLLASPLVPYNTVGFFLATIMAVSCGITLLLLPGVMSLLRDRMLPRTEENASGASESTAAGAVKMAMAGILGALVVFSVTAAHADELTDVNAIIRKANEAAYYAGDDGRAEVRMTITDSQGRERRRQFVILRKDVEEGGEQKYAVLFVRPADVRNSVFIVHKKPGGDDDRWLYLPDLDLVKRIAAGDKRTSFVGSDFFYEDVSGRSITEDTHELVETTGEHYVVRNTPKDPDSVEFIHWTAWIDKSSFLPTRMEYTGPNGDVYRKIEALETAVIEGHPTITKMKVSDVGGGHTVSEFRNIEYGIGIPDDVFTERALRNPSRQWFRPKRSPE